MPLNIQVDLIDASSGTQLWGQSYERELLDLVTVKQAITREVTEKLKVRLSGEEERRLVERDTANAEAYQSYLKGRYFWNKRTEAGLEKGIRYFQQAIEADPGYALAYVGLADSYNFLSAFGIAILPPGEAIPKARSAALRALEIDESLAEAHASIAFEAVLRMGLGRSRKGLPARHRFEPKLCPHPPMVFAPVDESRKNRRSYLERKARDRDRSSLTARRDEYGMAVLLVTTVRPCR